MTTLAVILTEGFADWECAHLMSAARTHLGAQVLTASPEGASVRSAGGLLVTPDLAMDEIDADAVDALVLCGGMAWGAPDAPDVSALIAAFAARKKLIAGICAAVGPLAATGLLDAVPHTGNDAASLLAVPAYAGRAHYIDSDAAIAAGNLVTAAGTALVSFMIEVLGALGYDRANLEIYADMLAAEHSGRRAAA